MKVYLCILLCFILPYSIGMDRNDPAKDEGLSSSPDDDPSDSCDQSPESPGSGPLPSRGPSRSRSVGQVGRIPYTIASPRKLNPRLHGASSCVSGSSMAPVPENAQALEGFGNVAGGNLAGGNLAGVDPSTSAASMEHGLRLPPVGHYGQNLQRSLPDQSPRRRRHHSAVDRPWGSGLHTAPHKACVPTKTNEMFEEFKNLNLSTKIVPKACSRVAAQNRPQQHGAPVENVRSLSRTLLSLLRSIHADYVSPLGISNPSVRDHRTLMRLLEMVSSSLQSIGAHPETVLGLQRVDSELFALTTTRIPEVVSDIRLAVDQYDTPNIDHAGHLRNLLARLMTDLFTIIEQIRGTI